MFMAALRASLTCGYLTFPQFATPRCALCEFTFAYAFSVSERWYGGAYGHVVGAGEGGEGRDEEVLS